ncbi:MAG: ArsC/Spx/MgsR family protein [Pseudomonadota bacterium]
MALKIYGYSGCSTVKRAVNWAAEKGIDVDYSHFTKVDDLEAELKTWASGAGIERLLNQNAQAFKKLDEGEQEKLLNSDAAAIQAMANEVRLIKRPVGTDGSTVLTGFNKDEWEAKFG